MTNKPTHNVVIAEKNGEKTYFHTIGAAWENKAGGFNVKLKSLPLDGELILFPRKENNEDENTEVEA